jgi:hypothetical protein
MRRGDDTFLDERGAMYKHTSADNVLPTTAVGAAAVNIWQWHGILGRLLRVNHPG